jgi:hypothetical protein
MWGMGENGDSRVYIASVGSPSERCNNFVQTRAALGTSRQVARVRTVLLTVHPVVAARIRTQASLVRTIGLHSRPDSKRVPSGLLSVWTPIETIRTLHTETTEN